MYISIVEALSSARLRLESHGVAESGLEAAVLLAHVLGRSRTWLLAHPEQQVDPADHYRFLAYCERRCRREPSAYIVGLKHWLDLEISVNRNVLIPRPETELLAAEAIAVAGMIAKSVARPVVVDAGTGSGALAIAVARGCPSAAVYGVDTSAGALRMAKANAEHYQQHAICFMHGDLLSPLSGPPDFVVANLPYIPTAEIETLEPELAYEPRAALDGGPDGLDVIRSLPSSIPPGRGRRFG
jgi:release factor glutamine methyltransferase